MKVVVDTNVLLASISSRSRYHWLYKLSPVHLITTYYRFRLITADADDNKFADCAFAATVDYLITNDKHFDILKEIKFPGIEIIRLEDFESLLNYTNE